MHVLGQLQKLLIVHAGPYSSQQPTIDHKPSVVTCGHHCVQFASPTQVQMLHR